MAARATPKDKALHRRLAVECFNGTWKLLLKRRRTRDEDLEMIHRSHASRYHWGIAGRPINWAIGEWQISRVYAVLGRAEPSLFHATRALGLCRKHGLKDFPLAFAYEALARAHAVARRPREVARYLRLARSAGAAIREADDRRILLDDLATIRPRRS